MIVIDFLYRAVLYILFLGSVLEFIGLFLGIAPPIASVAAAAFFAQGSVALMLLRKTFK